MISELVRVLCQKLQKLDHSNLGKKKEYIERIWIGSFHRSRELESEAMELE
jgi:hypothetical protein